MDDLESSTATEETLDDTLRETLAGIKARGADLGEDTPTGQTRDDAGKFSKPPVVGTEDKTALIKPVTAPITAPVTAQTPAAPVVAPIAEPEFVIPPELQRLGLKKDEAQAYLAAPKHLQDAFTRRAEEMGRGIETYKSKAQFADTIGAVLQPHMQTIQSLGVTPDVAIGKLLEADRSLRFGSTEQKIAKFNELAQSYGISFNPTGEAEATNPAIVALMNQVNHLSGKLQGFESGQQQQNMQSVNSQIVSFAADPKNEHFEAVREQMAGLLQGGAAPDLASAYEMAVWSNPATRAAMLAKQQADAQAEATRKAKEALDAASTNVRRRPSLPASEPTGSMEDTIRATYRRLQAA